MPRKSADTSQLMMAGLNLIQQAISIFDSDLRLIAINRRMQDMFGLPDALVRPGTPFGDVIRFLAEHGEYGEVGDIEAFVADRVDLARAFEPHYMERTRANGRTISVEGAPLPQGGWVTVYTDITRAKRQEALLRARSEELSGQLGAYAEELEATNRELEAANVALAEAKRELTEIEARTRLTTEMMPAHIAHVGPDRRYTYSNRRLNSVMPGRPADILGRHIAETLGSQAYSAIEPHLGRAFDGEAHVFEFNDELSSRRIRVAFTPDRQGDEIAGVYILSMDVTEETQARSALQQARRRQMAAQMTSGLAHDFSNLLTIILGTQGRLQRMPLGEDARELIAATHTAARRGADLLHRLADLTSDQLSRPVPTDVSALLRELQLLAAPSLPAGVTMEIRDELPDQPILVDPGTLRDALLNLILNARDACGTQGRIRIQARAIQKTWLEMTVSDTGPGFNAEALAHAFDPFFTTKGERGQGLGLAQVYDMVKFAGGEVKAANGYMGARVTLRLPLRLAVTAEPPAVPGLVLLVEDRPDLRESIRDMLTGMGHSVVEAASVPEAEALLAGLPDIALVLSDIVLEGAGTGIELANRLLPLGKPVYLMTSLPPGHDLHRTAAARVPVIAKPFTADALSALLQSGTTP